MIIAKIATIGIKILLLQYTIFYNMKTLQH